MSKAPHRLRHALSLVLLGLLSARCAPELALCQVDGAKYENDDGTIQVWVNPILYVRVFGDELFETTNVTITVLNGNEVLVPPTRYRNFTSDPGGEYRCPRTGSAMGSMMTGIMVPRTFPRTARLALSAKVDISDTSGTNRSYTVPVRFTRYVQEPMPSFSCTSTRCGR